MDGIAPVAVAIVGSCGVTRKRFLIEAVLESGILTCRSARSITPDHAAQLEANLTASIPQNVVLARSSYVCPECGSSNGLEVWQCTGCKVFHCAGRTAEGYFFGACGTCRFTKADFRHDHPMAVHAGARY